MSMAAVFRLHSLSDHCWALVGGDQALQCIAQGYWSVKTLGVHQTPHEVLWELSSPAIHCSSLISCCGTLTVGTAVPHHMAGGRERVCVEQ